MRLLLLNPNTTSRITDTMVAMARDHLGSGAVVTGATGRFGAAYISSRSAYAVAGHAALDAYAASDRDCDAVLLACFGDPGLLALKEVAPVPVIGMAEASCLAAAALGGRFAIVTGGERWGPMLEELVAMIGLKDRLAGIETIALTGADIARDPEAALPMLAAACRSVVARHDSASVILGGAALAGLASRIANEVPVPVVDSLLAGLSLAESVAGLGLSGARSGSFSPPPPVATVGLSPALRRMMEHGEPRQSDQPSAP